MAEEMHSESPSKDHGSYAPESGGYHAWRRALDVDGNWAARSSCKRCSKDACFGHVHQLPLAYTQGRVPRLGCIQDPNAGATQALAFCRWLRRLTAVLALPVRHHEPAASRALQGSRRWLGFIPILLGCDSYQGVPSRKQFAAIPRAALSNGGVPEPRAWPSTCREVCRHLGWRGDVRLLWQALDADGAGVGEGLL